MATTKITITLDDASLAEVRRLVARGKAKSVSGFVKHALDLALQDVAGWGALMAAALAETGGKLTAAERAWADEVLDGKTVARGKRKRKAA